MKRFPRSRSFHLGARSLLLALALAGAGCGGEEHGEEPGEEAGAAADTTAATQVAEADSAEAAPVRRWLPDEMARSTRVEDFPHSAHVEIACRVCHTAPRGHTVHSTLPCAECHRSSVLVTRQSLTPADCMACHHNPERGIPCSSCHKAPGPRTVQQSVQLSVWSAPRTKALTYDHGRHDEVECRTCHQQPNTMRPTRACASCHQEHHNAAARCQSCHAPSATAHDAGAHLGCLGSGCHNAPDVDAMSGDRVVCLVCHQAQENHEVGKECADCHQVRPGRTVSADAPLHDSDRDRRAIQW